jgi:signal transduction histidine kinase/ActR/RegA family two-component response regulator
MRKPSWEWAMQSGDSSSPEDRILVLAPTGNDGATACEVLIRAGFEALDCVRIENLAVEWERGASALLLAEEALASRGLSLLNKKISGQPNWSDIPIVILTGGGEISQARLRSLNAFAPSGNVTFLERPFRQMTLVSVMQVALRARRRQYQLRKTLAELHESESRLRLALEELKEGQARLLQAQKMEAVGKLAGGIAHDFNNMLTAINGYSEMLLDTVEDGGFLRQGLEEIRRSGERAAALTRQLLAYSRQQIMAFRVLDLNVVVGGVMSLLKRLIHEDIVLTVDFHSSLPNILADSTQIEQVILNLALNARDAMPKGGTLHLATSILELGDGDAVPHADLRPGTYVRLVVRDSGVGMDEFVKPRIFEPFFTTKEMGKGTGMGLSTVYGIVQQSGGQITVESSPGQGSVFTVYFPAAAAKSAKEADDTAALGNPPVAGGTVMVVEDEDSVRGYLREFLGSRGLNVLAAAQGQEALEIASLYPGEIDVLLTDVVMPNMSGRELAERLSAMRPGLKVLFISGYTDDAILQHGVLDGGTEFMNKPFSPPVLLQKIKELLANRTARAEAPSVPNRAPNESSPRRP